jgi:hypothetical protein
MFRHSASRSTKAGSFRIREEGTGAWTRGSMPCPRSRAPQRGCRCPRHRAQGHGRRDQLPWQPISANLHLRTLTSHRNFRAPMLSVAPSSMPTRCCRSGLGPKPSRLSTPRPRLKPGASVILPGTPPPVIHVPRAAAACGSCAGFQVVLLWGRACSLHLPTLHVEAHGARQVKGRSSHHHARNMVHLG